MNTLAQAKQELAQGNFSGVIRMLEPTTHHKPVSFETAYYLGIAFAQTHNPGSAVKFLKLAYAKQPQNVALINILAICHEQSGDFENALTLYQQGALLDPNNADIQLNMGDLLRKLEKNDDAVSALKKAQQLRPNHLTTMNNLAIALQQVGDFENAEKYFGEITKSQPENATAFANLGSLLHKRGRYEEAIASIQRALSIDPRHVGALVSLASPLISLGQLHEAEATLEIARSIAPQNPVLLINLGRLQHEKGQLENAVDYYNQALSLIPAMREAQWQRAFCYLLLGDYAHGWDDYEIGLLLGERTPRNFRLPPWTGQELNGKTIVVSAEQGLGDEIMFASCLDDLIARAQRVLVECDTRLVPLNKRAFPSIEIIERHSTRSSNTSFDAADYQISIGSLPRFFRRDANDYPVRNHYLVAVANKVTEWRARYAKLGQGLKIGISWRGGTRVEPLKRSISLSQWLPILATRRCHFIDLQYGDTIQEREALQRETGIIVHRFPETNPLAEQEDFAAQITALDLVISVSNSTVHLAGALGKSTWSLLPFVPSWRWTLQGTTTPWYKSVKLYRQPTIGDWASVIDAIATDLSTYSIGD